MPKTQIDYSKSIIYKLCCKDPEIKDIYIGSTTNFRIRKNGHKTTCNNINSKNYNHRVYKFIRDNGNWENWDMVMIEEYKECQSKLQLEKKERYYIETLCSTLNMCIPTRTTKEYLVSSRDARLKRMSIYRNENKEKIKISKQIHYQKNKDYISKKASEYRNENKEKIKLHKKEYYQKNKDIIREKDKIRGIKYRMDNYEKINEKHNCSCGGLYTYRNKSRHMKSKKHIKYQETHT